MEKILQIKMQKTLASLFVYFRSSRSLDFDKRGDPSELERGTLESTNHDSGGHGFPRRGNILR